MREDTPELNEPTHSDHDPWKYLGVFLFALIAGCCLGGLACWNAAEDRHAEQENTIKELRQELLKCKEKVD
jgi:hypothetical protein